MKSVPSSSPVHLASATGFGHGKVILLGEHAVVHGQPALAAGLSTGIRVDAVPGSGRLRVAAWNVDVHAGNPGPLGLALTRLLAELKAPPLDFSAETTLPAAAGLGSSAALSVAIARAAGAFVGAPETLVRAAVAAAETVFHSNPSGIDGAAAWSGGIGLFDRDQGWRPVAVRKSIKLLVGLSGEPRTTAAQVDAVGSLVARMPVAGRVIETLGACALAGVEALATGDVDTLGRLFDVAHGLLAALRVSSPALEQLVHGARAAGAIGAKLTGAGGGGAVIALAPAHRMDVLARWKADGFAGFETVIG